MRPHGSLGALTPTAFAALTDHTGSISQLPVVLVSGCGSGGRPNFTMCCNLYTVKLAAEPWCEPLQVNTPGSGGSSLPRTCEIEQELENADSR